MGQDTFVSSVIFHQLHQVPPNVGIAMHDEQLRHGEREEFGASFIRRAGSARTVCKLSSYRMRMTYRRYLRRPESGESVLAAGSLRFFDLEEFLPGVTAAAAAESAASEVMA